MTTATTTATAAGASTERGYWFSKNPSKAWGEKFFLLYSPLWMTQMAVVMLLHLNRDWGDAGYLVQALLVALPLVVVPMLIRDEAALGRRWYQTYWFKMNLWIFIFSIIGGYFGTEYFFDVLGMVYNYPTVHWNMDSALVGSGTQHVPVGMYLLTQAYFMTYHVSACVVLRRIRTSNLKIGRIAWIPVVLVVAYFWAWMETRAMANPLIAEQFYYKDLGRMLSYGSIFYACYFVVSFPMVYRLDEGEGECWSVSRTAIDALAAGMLVLFLLDGWARIIGPL
jgi:cycloeucalenol cycloisomerase